MRVWVWLWVRVRVWVRVWVWVGGRRMAHCALIDIVAVFSSHQPLVARVLRHYLARCFSPIVQLRGVTSCADVGKQADLARAFGRIARVKNSDPSCGGCLGRALLRVHVSCN